MSKPASVVTFVNAFNTNAKPKKSFANSVNSKTNCSNSSNEAPMNLKDFAKFKKLMQMTLSQNDGECLTAIRKANALLLADNKNWEELIDGKVTKTISQPYQDPGAKAGHTSTPGMGPKKDPELINLMFEELLRVLRPENSFRAFVEDVHSFWETKGWISDKQFEAITKAYERNC